MATGDRQRTFIVTVRLLSIVLLSLSLEACDERRQDTSALDPDIELMNDVGTAGPELERRLFASVSVQDGLIVVRPPSPGDTYVLPDNSPWIITCGREGVSVTFGNAVSGDGSYVGNDVQLDLTMTFIGQTDCATLATQLGRRLKTMLQELAHPQ
jgi:hypothetical protein